MASYRRVALSCFLSVSTFSTFSLLSHNLSKHQLTMHSRDFFNHLQISEIFISVHLNENGAYQSELNGPDVVKGFFFSL